MGITRCIIYFTSLRRFRSITILPILLWRTSRVAVAPLLGKSLPLSVLPRIRPGLGLPLSPSTHLPPSCVRAFYRLHGGLRRRMAHHVSIILTPSSDCRVTLRKLICDYLIISFYHLRSDSICMLTLLVPKETCRHM